MKDSFGKNRALSLAIDWSRGLKIMATYGEAEWMIKAEELIIERRVEGKKREEFRRIDE